MARYTNWNCPRLINVTTLGFEQRSNARLSIMVKYKRLFDYGASCRWSEEQVNTKSPVAHEGSRCSLALLIHVYCV